MPFDGTDYELHPEVAAHLKRVRDYLVEHGWCQDWPERAGRVCLSEAIRRTDQDMREGTMTRLFLARRIGGGVVEWNDVVGRSFAEVLAVVDV